MKKYLFLLFVLIIVFIIYLVNVDRKIYFLVLGNRSYDASAKKGYSFFVKDYINEKGILEKYIYSYSGDDLRVTDIINDIKNNKKTGNITLKNALIKADLITLNISFQDIYEKIEKENCDYNHLYDYIDDLLSDAEKLFTVMRKYCKENIVFIGAYNKFKNLNNDNIDDIFDYLNRSYQKLCKKYDIAFIEFNNVNFIDDRAIADKIIYSINKSIFKA